MAVVGINDLRTSPGDDPLPPAATRLEPAKGDPKKRWTRQGTQTAIGLAIVALVALAAWPITSLAQRGNEATPDRVDGLTIFAVFFVAALAIERLLEPLSLVDSKKEELVTETKKANSATVAALRSPSPTASQAADRPTAVQEGLLKDAEVHLQGLANAKTKLDAWMTYRALALWGIASVVGTLAAASLNLHLLATAGIKVPSLYLEILATGLILGAGTKPLHDLTKFLTAKTSTVA